MIKGLHIYAQDRTEFVKTAPLLSYNLGPWRSEFTKKYRNIFEAAEHVQMIYSSNTENEDVYYVVCYQCWDKQRIWEKNEFDDMFEITKILSMFMKSSHIITEREKFLQNKVDNDDCGVFTLSKFEEEVVRITRNAHVTNKKIGFDQIKSVCTAI